MIRSKGKNKYFNNRYHFWDWSAPVLQTHKEVLSQVKRLKLRGRIVKNIYAVGMGYNWGADEIQDAVYYALLEKIQAQQLSLPCFAGRNLCSKVRSN